MNFRLLIAVSISLMVHALALNIPARTYHYSDDANKSANFIVSLKEVASPLVLGFNTAPLKSTAKSSDKTSKSESRNEASDSIDAEIQDSKNHKTSWFSIPEPKYYSVSQLEHAPAILKNVDSDPPELLQFTQGGELTIQIWIDENGDVVNTEIVKSNLPEEFNKSALTNFATAKFSPGIRNNLPVKTVAKITVRYAPKEPNNN